jgi:cobalt ECF transporter T component CbiQ
VNAESLPEWYFADKEGGTEAESGRMLAAASYVRKTLAGIGRALANELCSPACTVSWLGSVEARAKILGLVLLVFGTTFVHGLVPLSALFASAVVMAWSIRLPMRRLARVWIGVPLFSLGIILPAVTNLVTPGRDVLTLWRFDHTIEIWSWSLPEAITVTREGLFVAGRFVLRTLDCVTLVYILAASTDASVLIDGLRRLGLPEIFGMVLAVAHRYIVLMLRAAEEIYLAKLSRTIAVGSLQKEQRWAAAGMGMLFRRTHYLAEEVTDAMVSRGYDGELRIRSKPPIKLKDAAFVLGAVLFMVALVALDRGIL